MYTCKQSRVGYTLIELLVVISIIAVLAAITVAFLPSVAGNATEARAASQLQGWLNVAKTRALRDQAPRGLRLWLINGINSGSELASFPTWTNGQSYNPPFDGVNYNGLVYRCLVANTNVVPTNTAYWTPWQVTVECQYTEQPDDFSTGVIASNPAGNTIFFGGTPSRPWTNDLWNGYTGNPSDVKFWSVQVGDCIEVFGTGLMHVIQSVPANNAVTIAPPLLNPIDPASATPNYRIVRAPRPVGDETLKLPSGTVVDLQTNGAYLNALPYTYEPGAAAPAAVDILFAPSGAVISRGLATANIHLWTRVPAASIANSSNDIFASGDVFRGKPTIVSVFARTGFTGAYDVSRSANPYSLVY